MKKFYKEVRAEKIKGGFQIALDARTVKTPGKGTLIIPTRALADAVAGEWRAQGDNIIAETMPLTRLINTVIDRVKPRFELVAQEITAFAETDLLCYRAGEPDDLSVKENQTWNPFLEWARETFGAVLQTTSGVMPIKQDEATLAILAAEVRAYDAFELTALHEFTNGFGSLVLALAYMKEFCVFENCWQASILHQKHQEALWGEDLEVTEKRAALLRDLNTACQFISHLRNK